MASEWRRPSHPPSGRSGADPLRLGEEAADIGDDVRRRCVCVMILQIRAGQEDLLIDGGFLGGNKNTAQIYNGRHRQDLCEQRPINRAWSVA